MITIISDQVKFFQENKNDLDEESCANIGSQVQDILLKLSTLSVEDSFEQQTGTLGTSEIDNLQ